MTVVLQKPFAPPTERASCGPPSQSNRDFSFCNQFYDGDGCVGRCANGYIGYATAYCDNGTWQYKGFCIGVDA